MTPGSLAPRTSSGGRMLLWVCVALVGVGLSGCQIECNRFRRISCESVNGIPYLLVETAPVLSDEPDPNGPKGFFAIYRGSPDGGSWHAVVSERLGQAYGTFAYQVAGGSCLGVFHSGRVSLFRSGDLEKAESPESVKTEFVNLPFEWTAETGAQLEDALYVFGGAFSENPQTTEQALAGNLKVARYDGQKFEVLNPTSAPELRRGTHGFWLKAVSHQGRIHVFWREAQATESLDLEPPMNFPGALMEAVFDGREFEGVRKIDLPQGYATVWSHQGRLRLAVQPQDRAFGRNAPLRMFTLPESGPPQEEHLASRQEPARLNFKYYLVERLPLGEREAFLRSNSQTFEVWRSEQEAWTVLPHPPGLPENNLEQLLYGLLGLSVLFVALGVGLAYRRRRQWKLWVKKMRPRDVLAPLSLRVSAHLIDIALIATVSELLAWLVDRPSPGPVRNLLLDLLIWGPYGSLYTCYLTLAESMSGATLGKLVLGLRVVSVQGQRPTFWAALVRNLIGFYERHPLLAPFAALPTILLTPRCQRLGDLLARTLVVQKTAMDRFRLQHEADQEALALREEEARWAMPSWDPPATGPSEEAKRLHGEKEESGRSRTEEATPATPPAAAGESRPLAVPTSEGEGQKQGEDAAPPSPPKDEKRKG